MIRPILHPFLFGGELFSIIVITLCLVIYFKTKKVFDLTKHKGINYFRMAFLFLAIAYSIRLVSRILMLLGIVIDVYILPGYLVFPAFLVLIGYSSTMAIIYLFCL